MGEFSPENTLQGPAEPFEYLGPLPGPVLAYFTRHKGHHVPQEHLSESRMVSFCSRALEVPVQVKNPPRK